MSLFNVKVKIILYGLYMFQSDRSKSTDSSLSKAFDDTHNVVKNAIVLLLVFINESFLLVSSDINVMLS